MSAFEGFGVPRSCDLRCGPEGGGAGARRGTRGGVRCGLDGRSAKGGGYAGLRDLMVPSSLESSGLSNEEEEQSIAIVMDGADLGT